ncbi:MAG: lytic murein transglycosylase [Acidimicrobiales bacterium]
MFDNRHHRSLGLRNWVVVVLIAGLATGGLAMVVATSPNAPDRAGASSAVSEGGVAEDAVAAVAVLVPDDRLDPRIAGLELRGAAWDRAVARLDAALFAQAENDRNLASATRRMDTLTSESADVAVSLRAVTEETEGLATRLADVEAVLAARALDRYVNFGSDPLLGLDDPADATELARSEALGERVDEVQFSTREEILERQRNADQEQRHLLGRSVELTAEIGSTRSVIEERLASVDALEREVVAATEAVRSARWSATLPGTDLSVVALDAYLNAEDLLAQDFSTCDLEWWMIAGVARIESWHGRYGGRSLRADGRADRPIIGIALDGGPGVLAIVDTDGGEYDGDVEWDRAVGPLQFIPETWSRRGRDGNGDGWADPQNLYDAAYSAGRYLCALGGDLSARSALRSAYFGYNNSTAYVNDVIGHADDYADFRLPDMPATPEPVAESVENPE